jgi:diadenosine tetraphosphate (Ap4A) HIT family hydrolase
VKAGCKGCETAVDQTRSIALPGGWTVNHYTGREGFFGWLSLQTVQHRCTLSELDGVEVRALGSNLQRLERGIYAYWRRRRHPVARIYVMYLLEGLLERGNKWHLHIHLVPRFHCLARSMRPTGGRGVDAYQIAKLYRRHNVPAFMDRRHRRDVADEEWKIVTGVVKAGRLPRRVRDRGV